MVSNMCSFWMGLLVGCVSVALADAECHCNTTAACAAFPSTPCSRSGDPDRCQEGWFGSSCQKQNVALRRTSNQSSSLGNNREWYGAALGVDGRATTNATSQPWTCAHTENEANPTWTVYLNTSVPEKIQHVRLYIRERLFDPFDRIIDIVARWPRSTHDSRILSQSGLFRLMESNNLPAGCHLLGDSGYPSKRWLLTPFLRPEPGSQARYNRAHKITRSCVERGIGQLKRRFGVLHGEIRQSPERTCKIIMAGAVLHNICKERNIPIPPADGIPQQQQRNAAAAPAVLPPQGLMGVRYREQFARTHFP
ncbi:putative nuclease HARBI1 [Haliotis asinina]|uniref:putative nuclease HARBI1 n=1 Tax=Haliotis asinina TaxID=109174 RepID=UPI003531FB5E